MSVNLPKIFTKGSHRILAVDPSGSHLAYVIATLDIEAGTVEILKAGMLWAPASFDKPERLRYMQSCIDSIINTPPFAEYIVDATFSEQFFSNPKMITGGSSIIPTVNNFLQMASSEAGIPFQEMGPSTWRSIIGIKAAKDAAGKRDWKTPAKDYVERYTVLPEKIRSNVDGRLRATPNDLTDALCIALAVAKYHGCDKVEFRHLWDYPLGHLNRFAQIAKGDK
jgi:Holliday junction resolvasome RuvABC endonuclease subunit